MATIPQNGPTPDVAKPAGAYSGPSHASNGVMPGSSGRLLKGEGMIGGAQEAHHQPKVVAHPQGPFVGRDGGRFKVDSK